MKFNKFIILTLLLIYTKMIFAASLSPSQIEVQALTKTQQASLQSALSSIGAVPSNPVLESVPANPTIPPVGPGPISGCCSVFTSANMSLASSCASEGPVGTLDRTTNGIACQTPKVVGHFSVSSPAELQIKAIKNSITASGAVLSQQILDNGTKIADKIAQVSGDVTKSIAEFQNNLMNDQVKNQKAMMETKMNYLSELKERDVRANNSQFSLDDTPEEIAFIQNQLDKAKQAGEEKTQIVVSEMKAKYDSNPNFIIPIRIKAADRVTASDTGQSCAQYNPDTIGLPNQPNSCFYPQKAEPGHKLQMIFEACSRAKKQQMLTVQQNANRRVMDNVVHQDEVKSSNTVVSSTTMASNQQDQRVTSCNAKELGFGLCEKGVSPQDYLIKVFNNEIVPNGNLSAANYFNPPVVGTYDGDTQIDGQNLKASLIGSLDKGGNGPNSNCSLWGQKYCTGAQEVSSNTPPLVNTYKTSAQYFAAKDFVSNILDKSLITNQSVVDRNKISSSGFQSKFLQRQAALSLAENALMGNIKDRIGSNIAESIYDNSLKRDQVIKESINGASYLDTLENLVNKDYSKIVVDGTGQISQQTTTEALSRTAPNNIKNWQYNADALNTKLKLENKMQNESIELLLATYLSQKENSANNINFLKQLKVQ